MIRKLILLLVILFFSGAVVRSQFVVKTSDLFTKQDAGPHTGRLNIIQDAAIDTLISRYILGYKNLEEKNGHPGMEGFRIQIYRSSERNARDESGKIKADFISRFPDMERVAYLQFAEPGYYIVRVGDFRSKTEATRLLMMISKAFPNAYIVPDVINYPDANSK